MFALSDAEVAIVGKAFDRAWDGFLRTGALTPENLWDSRNLLAARILRAVYYGERDEWRLARDAVSYLRQVIGSMPGRPSQQGFAQRPSRGRMKAPRGALAATNVPDIPEWRREGQLRRLRREQSRRLPKAQSRSRPLVQVPALSRRRLPRPAPSPFSRRRANRREPRTRISRCAPRSAEN